MTHIYFRLQFYSTYLYFHSQNQSSIKYKSNPYLFKPKGYIPLFLSDFEMDFFGLESK